MRIWFLLTAILFLARCSEQLRPYWKAFMGARAQDRSGQLEPPPARSAPASRELPVPPRPAGPRGLKVASWNLEWLDAPGRGPVARATADYAELAKHALRLDADVIAVQEVASEAALARVFRTDTYAFHLAAIGAPQRSGFVFRKDLRAKVHRDLSELAVGDLRAGADLEVRVGDGVLRLLSIHLKAFCPVGPLDPKRAECRKLSAQIPALEAWIDGRARERVPFVVLGDFNRALSEDGDPLLRELDDGDPQNLRLLRASTRKQGLCGRNSSDTAKSRRKRTAIDHLLLGGAAGSWLRPDSFFELSYEATQLAPGVKLSDHCPIGVELSFPTSS